MTSNLIAGASSTKLKAQHSFVRNSFELHLSSLQWRKKRIKWNWRTSQ